MFEYTAPFIAGKYRKNDDLRVNDLQELPTVLMPETSTTFGDDQLARIATLTDISVTGKRVDITYVFDPNFPPIPNATIEKKLRTQWDLTGWATSRNHWAIKDVDLFRSLLPIYLARRYHPRVFDLPEDDMVNDNLVSVMMPMDARLNPVYSTICEVAAEFEMDCKRADDIWESHAIMEDVVSLIFRSRIVIVDCSGDNPNVYYEMGIAHTLGRDVIPISQSDSRIPFDISHHRVHKYLNNGEGRLELKSTLSDRMAKILG